MNELLLISTFQCAKIFRQNKEFVRHLLDNKELEYVRDSERIFRISLNSVLEYAKYHKFTLDEEYLIFLKKKILPWREVETIDRPVLVAPQQPATHQKQVHKLSPELIEMGFCPRALNAFKRNDITTVEQLTNLRATDLMKFHAFGRKTLNNVRMVLSGNNLSLKNSRTE